MGRRHWILIIDDSKEIVAVLKEFFERKYETLTAYDGFEGLQLFEEYENSIDLVITDLLMPELSGFGMISILKRKYPGIPIIVITGYRGNVEGLGIKLEADQVIEKPFRISELDKLVSKLLTDRGAPSPHRELYH
jgi:DNA-binding response OmpR family regulator